MKSEMDGAFRKHGANNSYKLLLRKSHEENQAEI
jgi:hypothetical protein